eukprot:TRINITY_DN80018_c0_g1_i1.p1 TRINITY_DN80018_c0_g1~~TRINITY_DN80018_c0_g1_i1.p1  ORF type:complete len:108 (-),score=12.44 TRINITY_DN80018_c0_g1_i1:66-389(-)
MVEAISLAYFSKASFNQMTLCPNDPIDHKSGTQVPCLLRRRTQMLPCAQNKHLMPNSRVYLLSARGNVFCETHPDHNKQIHLTRSAVQLLPRIDSKVPLQAPLDYCS